MSVQERPNILWIMTDEQKYTALSCMWKNRHESPWMHMERPLTPNLDALADEGILFENAYCPCPVCAPSRASMKTGKYPAFHGAVGNWMPFRGQQKFLPALLREQGYNTGMAGKLHFFPPEQDYGFTERHLHDAPYSIYADDDKHSEYIKWLREEYFDAKEIDPVKLFDEDEKCYDTDLKRFCMGSCFRSRQEHETVWITDKTIEFLVQQDDERPFFFYASYFGPHMPYGVPEPYASLFSPDEICLPESYYQDEKKGYPVFERTARALRRHVAESMTERDCKELIAAYLGQIAFIDEEIGRIIQCLKKRGVYEDTVIIFTSDHGDHLGEHGLFFKSQMYDSCARVPLLIKSQRGFVSVRRKEIVNTIDLFRTILEIAGMEKVYDQQEDREELESRSLLPLLSSKEVDWDDISFTINGRKRDSLSCMIRSKDFKLIRSGGKEDAVYEMYCIEDDPLEKYDLYGKQEYSDICSELHKQLENWWKKQYMRYEE